MSRARFGNIIANVDPDLAVDLVFESLSQPDFASMILAGAPQDSERIAAVADRLAEDRAPGSCRGLVRIGRVQLTC